MLRHAALINTLPVYLPGHHLLQKSWALALVQLSDLLLQICQISFKFLCISIENFFFCILTFQNVDL